MRKAFAVGLKEFRQIRRDRRTLMILLFIPVFFLLLYGYALNFDIKHVRLAVEDRDYSPESRRLISAFVNSTYFDQVASVTTDREVGDLMDRDRIRAALVIPQGFGRDLQRGRPVSRGSGHQRRQLQHGRDRDGLRAVDRRERVGDLRAENADADAGRRRESCCSSRASGTTRSSRARCSWSPACSPTSR